MHFVQKYAQKKFGQICNRIDMRVAKIKGGASGGTIASIINMVKEATGDADLRRQLKDPYSLCPSDHNFAARQNTVKMAYDDEYGALDCAVCYGSYQCAGRPPLQCAERQ